MCTRAYQASVRPCSLALPGAKAQCCAERNLRLGAEIRPGSTYALTELYGSGEMSAGGRARVRDVGGGVGHLASATVDFFSHTDTEREERRKAGATLAEIDARVSAEDRARISA
eukprot:3658389-Pleurochrysis_carterae.AAC.1